MSKIPFVVMKQLYKQYSLFPSSRFDGNIQKI